MKALDLSKQLKSYVSGWVALDEEKNKVVAHAKTFSLICEKVKNNPKVVLIPASKDYFGFITTLNA